MPIEWLQFIDKREYHNFLGWFSDRILWQLIRCVVLDSGI